MIISSPFVIILSADEHHELTGRARGARAAHRDVVRAPIILAARRGRLERAGSPPISACTSTRSGSGGAGSASDRLAGLADLPRSAHAGSAPSRSRR